MISLCNLSHPGQIQILNSSTKYLLLYIYRVFVVDKLYREHPIGVFLANQLLVKDVTGVFLADEYIWG